jgi:hypothetical protein
LWPSSLMLMAWHNTGTWKATLGLLYSAAANGMIYSVLGFVLGSILKFFGLQPGRR